MVSLLRSCNANDINTLSSHPLLLLLQVIHRSNDIAYGLTAAQP
jgi:hypothetical protein